MLPANPRRKALIVSSDSVNPFSIGFAQQTQGSFLSSFRVPVNSRPVIITEEMVGDDIHKQVRAITGVVFNMVVGEVSDDAEESAAD